MCEAHDYREIVLNIFLYKMYTTFRSFATYEQILATYKSLHVHDVIVFYFAHYLGCTTFRLSSIGNFFLCDRTEVH
jgi:hypothetical protein